MYFQLRFSAQSKRELPDAIWLFDLSPAPQFVSCFPFNCQPPDKVLLFNLVKILHLGNRCWGHTKLCRRVLNGCPRGRLPGPSSPVARRQKVAHDRLSPDTSGL